MPDKSYYQLLQVHPAADDDVIRAAHRVLAARLHPETDITGVHEYRRKELDRALAVLTDPVKRREYDERLTAQAAETGATDPGRVAVGPGQGNTLAERMNAQDPGHLGATRIDFGRYAGYSLGELVQRDPEYLQWLSRHSSGIRYRGAILRLLAEREAIRQPLRVSP
ncbi:MAG TPA: J domain-containing protein [Candidatus Limnocylindria bacterium]